MENFILCQVWAWAWAWPWVGVDSSFLPCCLRHPTHKGKFISLPCGRIPDFLWQGQVWADKRLPASQISFCARQELQQRPTREP